MNSDHPVFSCVISPGLNFSERNLLLGIVEGVIVHHGCSPSEMKDLFSKLWRVLLIESPMEIA